MNNFFNLAQVKFVDRSTHLWRYKIFLIFRTCEICELLIHLINGPQIAANYICEDLKYIFCETANIICDINFQIVDQIMINGRSS